MKKTSASKKEADPSAKKTPRTKSEKRDGKSRDREKDNGEKKEIDTSKENVAAGK